MKCKLFYKIKIIYAKNFFSGVPELLLVVLRHRFPLQAALAAGPGPIAIDYFFVARSLVLPELPIYQKFLFRAGSLLLAGATDLRSFCL